MGANSTWNPHHICKEALLSMVGEVELNIYGPSAQPRGCAIVQAARFGWAGIPRVQALGGSSSGLHAFCPSRLRGCTGSALRSDWRSAVSSTGLQQCVFHAFCPSHWLEMCLGPN